MTEQLKPQPPPNINYGRILQIPTKPKPSPLRIIPEEYPTKAKDVFISLLWACGIVAYVLTLHYLMTLG